MKWLNKIELESERIILKPLKMIHQKELMEAATDGKLWELWYTSVPTVMNIETYIQKALYDYENDKGLAFVIYDKITKKIIGTTRYTNAFPEHKRLEIGYTWYAQSYQKSYANTECKLLLLQHAFEQLQAIAVEFRTNWFNFNSRHAIQRLGAKQDGVMRNHQIMADGSYRDTVIFSIIQSEWATCKMHLKSRLSSYK